MLKGLWRFKGDNACPRCSFAKFVRIGSIIRPALGVLFVPQEAYLCDGGLFAEEVSYPSADGLLGQGLHGEDIFERLGLGRVRERASHSQHNGSWERELTPGEKQRVALSFSLTGSCNQLIYIHPFNWYFTDNDGSGAASETQVCLGGRNNQSR